MNQSLSGGPGTPSRIILTVICLSLESSNMREIIACMDFPRSKRERPRNFSVEF